MNVGPLVVADTKASKLIEPRKCPLDDPAPSSQTAAVLGTAHRQQRQDAASSQPGSDGLCIVAAVSHHRIWATSRPSPRALEWRNRIHQRQCLLRVVSVGAGQANRERHAPPVADQMTLAPALGRSVGFGPVWSPPQTARTEQLSTTASDQSIWSERASQSSSAKCIRSQTPARCQSRRRRQHVIPDPHPSSCGSICQGIPLRRTKTMPVRHARSETRGRPPCGRRARIGKKGSTRFHNRSGSNAAAIRRSRYFADEDQVR